MKKITFITGGMSDGGAERVISILANHFHNKSYKVDIIMLLHDNVGYKLADEINLVYIKTDNYNIVKKIFIWVSGLRKYFKKNKDSVIVSFFGRINILTIFSSMFLPNKIIVSERNDPRFDGRGKITFFLTKVLYMCPKYVVFQTREVSNLYKHLQNKVIIPNPIELHSSRKKTDKYKFINIGRLMPQKNQIMLIRAFSKVVNEYNDYKLYIYGDGDLKDYLSNLIRSLGMENNIFLMGNSKKLHKEIADSYCFILSSNYEGLSNALMECVAMGIPSISTDCAGASEIIKDGLNGYIVPVGDTDQLVVAIIKMIKNNSYEQMEKMCYKSSLRYDFNEVVLRWEEIICH